MESALYAANFAIRTPVAPSEIPNRLTVETLLKSERGEDVHRAKDIEDLFSRLK